ncbi:hypothetical protein LSAT2_016810 [Lamellibrachia satsuma]|nr:hypothetical protein LSAT2_016810 [Lamellibrachia satsuma]
MFTTRQDASFCPQLLAVVSAFIVVSLMTQPIAATTTAPPEVSTETFCGDLCHVQFEECTETCHEEAWTPLGEAWNECNNICTDDNLQCIFECRSMEF